MFPLGKTWGKGIGTEIVAVPAAAASAWVYGVLHHMTLPGPWMATAGIPVDA